MQYRVGRCKYLLNECMIISRTDAKRDSGRPPQALGMPFLGSQYCSYLAGPTGLKHSAGRWRKLNSQRASGPTVDMRGLHLTGMFRSLADSTSN